MLATVRSTPNSELLQQAPGKQETRLKNDFAFDASTCLRWRRKPGSLPAFGQTTNQTMDSQDNNYTAPRQENGVIDESGNVDRIRNILFGSQMRDYDGRFQKLEERLAREASELRSELQRQLQALEAFMKGEAESMTNRVKGEQSERAQAIQQLAREMGETVRGIELKISNLDSQAAKDIRDLREQLLEQSKALAPR